MDRVGQVEPSGLIGNEEGKSSPERHYYLDWLRVGALVSVFLFHALHIFAPLDWHINNEQRSPVPLLLMAFINGWSMPLFFVLAGAGAWFALQHRSSAQFMWSRLKRLVVPYVFGVAVIILPQKYVEALHKETFSGSFFAYLPHYFQGIRFHPHVGQLGNIGYHLWFIAFLFIYSILTLPLLQYHKTRRARQLPVNREGESGYVLLLFLLPLMMVQVGLGVRHAGYLGWSNFVYWLLFYIYGFLLVSSDASLAAIQHAWRRWLGVAGLCFAVVFASLVSGRAIQWWFAPVYSVGNVLFLLLLCVNAWSWVLAFIGMSREFLSFNHRFLQYANTAVLPFYILHQTIIVLVGYYVVQLQVPMSLKYLLIVTLSFIAIVSLYESVIRRVAPLRFLFGMK